MDAIVIGAGLAGLAAAERLLEEGGSVTVIEGRERVGGRVWSEPNIGSVIELGPEWFDPSGPMGELLHGAGAEVRISEGEYFHRADGRWQSSNQQEVVRRLVRRLRNAANPDLALNQALRRELRGRDADQARQYLIPYVEGFHAADPDLLSVQWLGEVERNQSADESEGRTPQGLSRGVQALSASLNGRAAIRLGTVAREVRWQPGKVEIELAGDTSPITARCAIVTVPLGVIKSGALRFTPELAEKRPAMELLEMGHVKKVVLSFRRRFWRELDVPEALFLQDFAQPFPTWWMPVAAESAALVGWVGGPPAIQLAEKNPEAIVDLAIGSLAGMLGLTRAAIDHELDQTWFHDWSSDPLSLGGYSYIRSGGLAAPAALGRPVEATLFFAGEATCEHGYNATMDGAIQSGRRAAKEVIAQIKEW